jgi:predicted RecA/RadA family phage recombinase
MKNKVDSGDVIDFTAPTGGVTSGLGVLIGANLFLISVTTAAAGVAASVWAEGSYDHVAEGAGSGQDWTPGDTLYWDNTAKQFTKTSSGNTKRAVAVQAKGSTATSGRVRLVPNC